MFIELIKVVFAKSRPDANFQFAIIIIMGIIVISSKEKRMNVKCSSWNKIAVASNPRSLDTDTVWDTFQSYYCISLLFHRANDAPESRYIQA